MQGGFLKICLGQTSSMTALPFLKFVFNFLSCPYCLIYLHKMGVYSRVGNWREDVRDVTWSPQSVLHLMLRMMTWVGSACKNKTMVKVCWAISCLNKLAPCRLASTPWQLSPKYPASMATVTIETCKDLLRWCHADMSWSGMLCAKLPADTLCSLRERTGSEI